MEKVEAGIVLTGTEVKSLRNGKASLEEAYAEVDRGEVWLYGCDIPEYLQANRMNHMPKRPRKLLLHRREIDKLGGQGRARRGSPWSRSRSTSRRGSPRSRSASPGAARPSTSARPSRSRTPSATSIGPCAGARMIQVLSEPA